MMEHLKSGPVPPVDPGHLQKTVLLVFAWTASGEETEDDETMPSDDLHSLLNRLVSEFDLNREGAIALFKRALALAAFCDQQDLPPTLFDEGFPGRELCTAASKATVLDMPGGLEEEMGHTFDADEMQKVLATTRH